MAAAAESDLVDLAREAVAAVARRVTYGECAFHCQMLASKFYEAAKAELQQTSPADGERAERLSAVLERCEQAGNPRAQPAMILAQLTTVLALMEAQERPFATGRQSFPRAAPKLRVIQGGLSLAESR